MLNQMNIRTRIETQESYIHTAVKLTFVALLVLALSQATTLTADAHVERMGGGAASAGFENEPSSSAMAKLFGLEVGSGLFSLENEPDGTAAAADEPADAGTASGWIPIVDHLLGADIENPETSGAQSAVEPFDSGRAADSVENEADGNAQFADGEIAGGSGLADVESPEGGAITADIEQPDMGSSAAAWQQELPEGLRGKVSLVTYVLLYLIK